MGDEALQRVNDSGNVLHAACDAEDNSLEVIDYLINEFGIDPFARNMRGETPMHVASRFGSYNSLLIIIDHYLKIFEKQEKLDESESEVTAKLNSPLPEDQ